MRLASRGADRLPRLTINLFSGGKHAGGQVPIQDVLWSRRRRDDRRRRWRRPTPSTRPPPSCAQRKYGMRALTADEGGLAPPFPDVEAMLADARRGDPRGRLRARAATSRSAVDVASSHFYRDGRYHLGGESLDSRGDDRRVCASGSNATRSSASRTALAEDDWEHWPRAARGDRRTARWCSATTCSAPTPRASAGRSTPDAADALLLKVNQIGTLTEAAEALPAGARGRLARSPSAPAAARPRTTGWPTWRSAGRGDQIKVGSITQSERLAKYNRLLAIEAETGLPVVAWPAQV